MISFRGSPALKHSPKCLEAPRPARMDNLEWLNTQLKELRRADKKDSFVILLGGRRSVYDFRLQVAQSHVRGDLTPSHWSHVAMLSTPATTISNRSRILEASLEPYEGFQVPSMHNGLQAAPLSRYADPANSPNIAVIRVPVPPGDWQDNHGEQKSILAQFADQRSVLDVTTLMLEWLAYAWGAGEAPNPLLNGHDIPSAAVIEAILGAAGYDVSPGLDTAASSPEAFWQTAKWWHTYYEAMAIEQMVTRYVIADEIPGDTKALRPRTSQEDDREDDHQEGSEEDQRGREARRSGQTTRCEWSSTARTGGIRP